MDRSKRIILFAATMILPIVVNARQAPKKPAQKKTAAKAKPKAKGPVLSAANQQVVGAGKTALAQGNTAALLGTPLTTALGNGPTTAALNKVIQNSPNASAALKQGSATIAALVTAPGGALNPTQAAAASAALAAFVSGPVTSASTATFNAALKTAVNPMTGATPASATTTPAGTPTAAGMTTTPAGAATTPATAGAAPAGTTAGATTASGLAGTLFTQSPSGGPLVPVSSVLQPSGSGTPAPTVAAPAAPAAAPGALLPFGGANLGGTGNQPATVFGQAPSGAYAGGY